MTVLSNEKLQLLPEKERCGSAKVACICLQVAFLLTCESSFSNLRSKSVRLHLLGLFHCTGTPKRCYKELFRWKDPSGLF